MVILLLPLIKSLLNGWLLTQHLITNFVKAAAYARSLTPGGEISVSSRLNGMISHLFV